MSRLWTWTESLQWNNIKSYCRISVVSCPSCCINWPPGTVMNMKIIFSLLSVFLEVKVQRLRLMEWKYWMLIWLLLLITVLQNKDLHISGCDITQLFGKLDQEQTPKRYNINTKNIHFVCVRSCLWNPG